MNKLTQSQSTSTSKPRLNLSRTRALVVDDNSLARTIMDYALNSLNIHEVVTAESAPEALALLRYVVPDLVFVDWVMQPIDGIEFVKRVRGDEESPLRFVPIIMVTAYAEPWRVHEARDAGANEFIVKPFAAKTLYAKIRSIVDGRRPFIDVPDGYFGPDRRRRSLAVEHDRRAHPNDPDPTSKGMAA